MAAAIVGLPTEDATLAATTLSPKTPMHRHAETADGNAHMHAIKQDATTPMCRQAWHHGSTQPGAGCANYTAPPPKPPPSPPSSPSPPDSPPPPSPPPSPAPPSPSPPMIVNGVTCSNACLKAARPNFQTGQGYYAYSAACLKGGVGCVGNTGCRLCSMKHGDPGIYGMCPGCVGEHYKLTPPPPPPLPPSATPCPSKTCTSEVWARVAANGMGTCGRQIEWVQSTGYQGHTSWRSACKFIAEQLATPECKPCVPTY